MYQMVISKAYQTIDKLLQRSISLPSDLALFISNLEIVEQQILYPRYQKFLRDYHAYLPTLLPDEAKIVQDLEQSGISITTLDQLAISSSDRFFDAAQSLSQELRQQSSQPLYTGKHTLTANAEQIMRHPELFLWGAEPKLLKIVEGYLKLPVAYDGLSYYYSPADAKESGPRKWHIDKEDWQMIKIGVYINDVNEHGGPFECVTPPINQILLKQLRSKSLRKYKSVYHHEVQNVISKHHPTLLSKNWHRSCIGKAGTVIFVDTAKYYHRGKPPTKFGRSAIFFGYCSRRPRHPFFCGRSPLSNSQIHHMASLLPEEIRDCITWRDRLAGIAKLIPKNRLRV
jgi:hypothetical protein